MLLYSHAVFVSVRALYDRYGVHLSAYQVKIQRGVAGWLVLGESREFPETPSARLVDDNGRDIVEPLQRAVVRQQIKGKGGMCIEGVHYVAKGRKHSRAMKQAWWCQAPPVIEPYIDHAARVAAATEVWRRDEEQLRKEREG